MTTLYEDKFVTLSDKAITINKYYFPLGQSKTIPYDSIKKVSERKLNYLFERLRLWGGGLKGQWMHWDASRPGKPKCILIDTGKLIDAGITPEKHDVVYNLLQKKIQQ